MQDLLSRLETLHRPRLLIRAARLGVHDYCRNKHLPTLLGLRSGHAGPAALHALIDLEDDINERRIAQDASYSIRRHVEVLVALIAEARLSKSHTAS